MRMLLAGERCCVGSNGCHFRTEGVPNSVTTQRSAGCRMMFELRIHMTFFYNAPGRFLTGHCPCHEILMYQDVECYWLRSKTLYSQVLQGLCEENAVPGGCIYGF
jgi:hypothetical protein